MPRIGFVLVTAAAIVAGCLPGHAQEAAATDAGSLARSLAAEYVAAYNGGDVEKLAALYAEDAQVALDGGAPLVGRAAVVERISAALEDEPGLQLALVIGSGRFLTPEVLVEKGTATVGDEVLQYACTYTKTDGRWLIAEIQEVTLPSATEAQRALGDLAWMVGRWKDENDELDVASEVAWSRNGHFLRRSVTVSRDGEVGREALEVIGFDPVAGRLRSWVFDSDGGFGEGFWVRDGAKWLVSFRGTGPAGSQSSAQHVMTYIDPDTFTWESYNRQVDGEVMPAVDKTTVVRVTGSESGGN